jgi:hypothetical protein
MRLQNGYLYRVLYCRHPILGLGHVPISGYPISGHTRYRVYPISGMSLYLVYPISGPISGYTYIGTKCHDIGSLSFPISHTMSLVPSRPRVQGLGWLSGCCRLLVIARESFIQCNELYLLFPAAAAAPAAPGPPAPAAAAAAPPAAVAGSTAVASW